MTPLPIATFFFVSPLLRSAIWISSFLIRAENVRNVVLPLRCFAPEGSAALLAPPRRREICDPCCALWEGSKFRSTSSMFSRSKELCTPMVIRGDEKSGLLHSIRCRVARAAQAVPKLVSAVWDSNFRAAILLVVVIPTLVIGSYLHGQTVTYFLRPLWERPPRPFKEIPHYYHENVSMDNLCKLHGWGIREFPRRVFDAVLFSNELDILAIRWHELDPYVSEFVLLESNSTFSGLQKPLVFAENRKQFEFIESRLTYGTVGGRFVRGENPFVEESYQRVALDQLIRVAGIDHDDLLIMSDADEIPSSHTINLLRWCDDIPEKIHLRMRNYLYSFEFLTDYKSWRASVHRYRVGKTRYAHYRHTDEILSDSGWHCSFCFRYISEFIFKMKAYSHVDRVKFAYFLEPSRIQDVICRGANLFDMLPEEHRFQDIVAKLGPIPSSYSAVHLPAYLLWNVDKYKYLLPGNCKREG